MNVTTLHKDNDFILVNVGSEKEKDLIRMGWKRAGTNAKESESDAFPSAPGMSEASQDTINDIAPSPPRKVRV